MSFILLRDAPKLTAGWFIEASDLIDPRIHLPISLLL